MLMALEVGRGKGLFHGVVSGKVGSRVRDWLLPAGAFVL